MKFFLYARKQPLLFALVAIFAFVGQARQLAYACPGCKEGFDKGTEQAGVGIAYSFTICLMILLPVIIIGTLVYKIRQQMDSHTRKVST